MFKIKEYIYSEDGSIKFLRNVGSYLLNGMALLLRNYNLNLILRVGCETAIVSTLRET
jgi:hypothetical protein